jgi:hypothetical protein
MSRTSEEELGRRRFQLSREQAVEAAIEKIRHAPAVEWQSFSGTEYMRLRDILGELWINLEREKWDEYVFSTLTREDIRALLTLGASAQGHTFSRSALEGMDGILAHAHKNPKKT